MPPAHAAAGLRLGFACHWDRERPTTWSGIPWHLLIELQPHADIIDIDPALPSTARHALRLAHVRRANGSWVSPWRSSHVTRRLVERRVRRAAASVNCDVVVQIGDLAAVEQPYFVFQDLSFDVLLAYLDSPNGTALQFPSLSRRAIERARDRQHRLYDHAAGVLAMSHWLAARLVEWSGVPEHKVHVVEPGASALARPGGATPEAHQLPARSRRHRSRLLFIGKDFIRKGGDLVLDAVGELRAAGWDVELTVVGPRRQVQAASPSDGVRFLGRISFEEVSRLFASHDLLVLPSRFEAFGIAFVEALGHGMPCIGRDAFAMPEIIAPGHNGDLVSSDDPAELAQKIVATLANDRVFERCEQQAQGVRRHYSWSRAASDVMGAVTTGLHRSA